jgi:hypothetical protein
MAVLAVTLLVVSGILTRSVAGVSEIIKSDKSLIFMQRMGPPPGFITIYQALAANTVTIRSSRGHRLISTGLYVGDLAEPGAVPSLLEGLPGGLKRFIQIGGSDSVLAYFVAPARGLTLGVVRVATSWRQLDGAVITIDRAADLAAIVIVLPESELSKFYLPLPVDARPLSAQPLRVLLLHRDPAVYTRSKAFVFTRGGVADGVPWCDTPVNGASAGSPLVYVSPAGDVSLLGLAVPAPAANRCAVIGSWTVGRFIHKVASSADGGGG